MRIGIIGGDVFGLVAARLMADRGHQVQVFEPGIIGRSFILPTFKYLERTTEVVRLLDRLSIPHGEYPVQGGLLINGEVTPFRRYLLSTPDHAKRIQFDYYKKTRLTVPDSFGVKGIDDPEVGPLRHAISCDFVEFVRAMAKGINVVRQEVRRANQNQIVTKEGSYRFDRIVVCAPLWRMQNVFSFDIPDAMAVKTNVVQVEVIKDRFLKWDFVYTPYTPGQLIHRLYHHNDGYACQFSGELDEDRLQSDLNFLFPDGWHVDEEPAMVPGYLLPLAEQIEWPPGVIPIGKYARWDSRATVTATINEVGRMIRLWNVNT